MPAYSYKIQKDGEVENGTVQAQSLKDALATVKKLGGAVVDIQEVKVRKSLVPHRGRLSLKERIIFTEQLSVMLKAGITLVQALKGLQEETSNHVLADILHVLVQDVEGGLPFSDALMKHPKVFSNIYCQMIRSAEKSGNLSDILSKLTTQQQKEYELKGKVKGALMYPAIVSCLLLAVIIMVITFILPKLTSLFADSGVKLPLATRILLATSNIFVHQWYLLIGGFFAALFIFKAILKTEKGLLYFDTLKLKVPVLGGFIAKSYMARFAQSFASLAQAGIPVLEIFETLEGVIGNKLYEQEIKKIAADVENGIKVSTAIRKSKYFPGMVGQLVSVGEQSGDLAGIFIVLGDFFEKEVDGMAKNLSTILEPIIMIVMGVGVGFVLIAVLQPIMNISSSI